MEKEITAFLHYMFAPTGAAWYTGAVWPNVIAVLPCGIVGFIWSDLRQAARHEENKLIMRNKHEKS